MIALAFALLLAQAEPAQADAASPAEPAPAEAPWPVGAPRDDYLLVAWCYGALRGYVDLHAEVMPEVVRIESQFRRPGSKLEDDLKVYADQRKQAESDLEAFRAALTAAEKASVKSINAAGAQAVMQGRAIWTAAPGVTKARVAQEWMSWTLPARCTTTAAALEQRARLAGPAFRANAEPTPQE